MKEFDLNGVRFTVADGEPGEFEMFNEGHPKANDTGPYGMVEEMKAFIRIQDEYKLRSLVDVGALFGVFSLVFTRYRDTKACAIEPSPWAYDGLCENVCANPERNIYVLQTFCGQKTGSSVNCGRQWKHLVAGRWPDSPDVYPTAIFALDDIAFAQSCDCIKIDVEGYECEVLRGAQKLIRRQKPIIFLEAHFSVLFEVSADNNASLFQLIKNLGYTPFTFQGNEAESFEGLNGHRFVLFPDKI